MAVETFCRITAGKCKEAVKKKKWGEIRGERSKSKRSKVQMQFAFR